MRSQVTEVAKKLKAFGEVYVRDGVVKVVTDEDRLKDLILYMLQSLNARLATTVGVDTRVLTHNYRVIHIFSIDDLKIYVLVELKVPKERPAVRSITPLIPGADWSEREVRDLLGIEFKGHPTKEYLIRRPKLWLEHAYPLRKDYPHSKKVLVPSPQYDIEPTKGFSVAIGPYHPALHEPEHFELVVDGERICGICGFTHSVAYTQAVESALGIDPPERAKYIRSILLEIERVHSHLLWFGVLFHVLGFDTGFMNVWRIREPVMELAELLTGNRKTYGVNKVGGVRRDIDESKVKKVKEVVNRVRKEFTELIDKFLNLSEVIERTKGVGVLEVSDAKKLCVVGPTARASSIDIDTRRDHPYAAYPNAEFKVPVSDGCDVYSRALVRRDEILESLSIIEQLVSDLPKTPLSVEEVPFKELSEGVGATEAPRGENVHYVITGRSRKLFRWRVRAPSYANIPSLLYMLRGQHLADAPAIIASIDPCFSCTDRVLVINLRYGTKRYVTLRKLRSLGE
ncbi:MAG: hydrogenase 3 large subunit [Desulfurococcales archaeon ex4484_42]|nr:MAG: hydrogenase 3 large subunit [Desulfurococcales archaeon ex4484_42]